MSSTRKSICDAWAAAQLRDADSITLDAAACAGLVLVQANGDARDAVDLVPRDARVYSGRVRAHLLAVVAEEIASPGRRSEAAQ